MSLETYLCELRPLCQLPGQRLCVARVARDHENRVVAGQRADDLIELGAFLPKFLSAIRIVPDAGLLELALYFLQSLVFIVVIKDTSSKSRCAPRDL